MSSETREAFLRSARAWICDGYALDIRYMAGAGNPRRQLWQVLIGASPLPPRADLDFRIAGDRFVMGQLQKGSLSKKEVLELLENASLGAIPQPGETLALSPESGGCHYHSQMTRRDRWLSDLHLEVSGGEPIKYGPLEWTAIDDLLRVSTPPFDGLVDAVAWLGLNAPEGRTPAITLRVSPPCDIVVDRSALRADTLTLTLLAHPQFDLSQITVAVRAVPDVALEYRRQIAAEIEWEDGSGPVREGCAQIELKGAHGVLTMLSIGPVTVRRQWFIDPQKSRNNRFLAMQHFDRELRMLREAVLVSGDGSKFERGIAALAFLLGFIPCRPIETDAPDLIVATPSGRLVLIECTTRIADFHKKLGNLVHRRGSLSKALDATGASAIAAVLVCRLPSDQIGSRAAELNRDSVLLITEEDLVNVLNRLQLPNDPEHMLDEALKRLGGNGTGQGELNFGWRA